MSHGVATPRHRLNRQRDRAKALFVELCGEGSAFIREAEIAALPIVEWQGKTLRTLRCQGISGKGPHDCNVPEGLLWGTVEAPRFPVRVSRE